MSDKIVFDDAYFIKLGKKGKWEEECVLNEQTIRLGFNNPLHSKCLNRNWEPVRKYWIDKRKTKGKVTEIVNQIKTFYESGERTLWITFFNRKLYWCFAEKKVIQLDDGSRIRNVNGKWSCTDVRGNPLTIENLSGKLTKVQGFQGTICSIKEQEYLRRKLNYQKLSEVKKAEKTLKTLYVDIEPLIKNLTWKDFELLVDLIFSYAGWQRISTVGKTEKSIDLELISPVSGNRAFVQIKSKSNMKTFKEYIKKYQSMKEQFHEMYFVVHSPDESLNTWRNKGNIKLWDCKKLSELVINSGLVNWLIKKTS